MTVSTKTLTAVAVLTNPLVWVALALALVYCMFYAMYLYCKEELSTPDRRVRFQLPWAAEPECLTCAATPPAAPATLKPDDKWATSGTPAVVTTAPVGVAPLLNLAAVAKAGAEQMVEAAAQSAPAQVAKTPRKRPAGRTTVKKKSAAKPRRSKSN
jgi:hypothetical protein